MVRNEVIYHLWVRMFLGHLEEVLPPDAINKEAMLIILANAEKPQRWNTFMDPSNNLKSSQDPISKRTRNSQFSICVSSHNKDELQEIIQRFNSLTLNPIIGLHWEKKKTKKKKKTQT